jgi:integrase
MPLTAKAVEAAKPRDKPYKLTDEKGLYLYVSTAGGKSWRANFTNLGKQQTRTYGRFPDMGLSAAREAHQGARVGPVAAKVATFEEVARKWLKVKQPSLSNAKHQIQLENTLAAYAFPAIGSKPIDQITRKELAAIVTALGDKNETAHRVAGRIAAVFDYAVDIGEIEAHPASHLSRVLQPRKVKKPMPCIPWQEAGELLRAIDGYPEPVTRFALQLLAYTFPRVNEFRWFNKDELRESGAIWVIPEERMKLGILHVVPMSTQARAIADKLAAMSGCELVIESPDKPGQPLSENTLLFALYRLGYRGRMTAHGFRSLASTVMNEQSGYAHDVIERQLAHKETDQVRAAYNRAQYLDQRRALMQWWADWLDAAKAKR